MMSRPGLLRPTPENVVDDLAFNHLLICGRSSMRKHGVPMVTDLSHSYDAYGRLVWTRHLSALNLEYTSEIVCALPGAKQTFVSFTNSMRCGRDGEYRVTNMSLSGDDLNGEVTFTGVEEKRSKYKGDFYLAQSTMNIYCHGKGKLNKENECVWHEKLLR